MYKYTSMNAERGCIFYNFKDNKNENLIILKMDELLCGGSEEFETEFSDIDCLLSARFHEIFLNGMEALKIYYCNKDLETINKDKDFRIDFVLLSCKDADGKQEYNHAYSYITNHKDDKLYIFDSDFSLHDDDKSHLNLMKVLGKNSIEYINTNREQGNSKLCGIYTTMFCRLTSQCKDFDEFYLKKIKLLMK